LASELITQSMQYDGFRGPQLDPELWAPFSHSGVPLLEPDAKTTVADGVLTVEIPKFTHSNPEDWANDATKHVVVSTKGFAVPADTPVRLEVDLAVDHVGADGDYRFGTASFVIVDSEGSTGTVLNFLATVDRVYAEHEVLPWTETDDGHFTRMIESPFAPVRPEGFRHLVVEIDRPGGRVTWTADGESIHEALGLDVLPDSLHIGFAFFTNTQTGVPSNLGQGGCASWRDFRYTVAPEG
jgi:hypothetical protein